MNSELIGILGATLFAGVLGVFWFSRLNGKQLEADLEHDGQALHADAESKQSIARSAYQMKLGTPDFAPKAVDVSVAAGKVEARKVEAGNEGEDMTQAGQPAIEKPDCPEAAMNLSIAAKLEVIGDFEGVREIAALVVESASASERQKAYAKNLLRSHN